MNKLRMRALSAVFQAQEIKQRASNQAPSALPKERDLWVAQISKADKARPVIVVGYLGRVEQAVVIPLYSKNKNPMETTARLVLYSLERYNLKKFSQVGADNTAIVPKNALKDKFGEIDTTDFELIKHFLRNELWLFRIVQLHLLTDNGYSIDEANKLISAQIETDMDFVKAVSELS
jgi:mRNA-degrading endonuclease toxin of MazEF toxin-antitoxin module